MTGVDSGSGDGSLVVVAGAEEVDGGARTASGAAVSSSTERRRGRRGGRLRETGGGGVLAGRRGTLATSFTRTTQNDHRRAPFVGPRFYTHRLRTSVVATPRRVLLSAS